MNICVFLSAADLDERYTRPAREFAELIGKGGHTLVWGGSDTGLMKVVADGVQETGGRLVGVSVELFRRMARTDADEMVFAKDLAERKALLLAAIGRGGGDGRRPGHAGRGDRDPGAAEARTARQAGGAAEHGRLLRRVDHCSSGGWRTRASCRCRWPSWSTSPTRAPMPSPT